MTKIWLTIIDPLCSKQAGMFLRGKKALAMVYLRTPDECNVCGNSMSEPRGQQNKFTRKCTGCGDRLFVYVSATAPALHVRRSECPKGMRFYDFVRRRVGTRIGEYPITQDTVIEPAAAPG